MYKPTSNISQTSSNFFQSAISFSESFKEIGVHIQSRGLEPVKDILQFERNNVITYMQYYHICFAFNVTIYEGISLNFTNSYRKTQIDPMLYMSMNLSNCALDNTCHVFITHFSSLHLDRLGSPFRAGTYTIVGYIIEELHLQPFPYVTECRDYKLEGLISQEDCSDLCFKKKYLEKYNLVQSESYVMRHENVSFKKMSDPIILSFCEKSCSQVACELHQFTISADAAKSLRNSSTVLFNFPYRKILVNYLPKVPFWDFMTLFGSVFGLWFGVSTFGLIDQFLVFSFRLDVNHMS